MMFQITIWINVFSAFKLRQDATLKLKLFTAINAVEMFEQLAANFALSSFSMAL